MVNYRLYWSNYCIDKVDDIPDEEKQRMISQFYQKYNKKSVKYYKLKNSQKKKYRRIRDQYYNEWESDYQWDTFKEWKKFFDKNVRSNHRDRVA